MAEPATTCARWGHRDSPSAWPGRGRRKETAARERLLSPLSQCHHHQHRQLRYPGSRVRLLRAGMLIGAAFVGVHMALTHGVTLGMVASYIPATEVEGIGRITGTCWSFTDFIFGESNEPVISCAACWSLGIAVWLGEAAPPKPLQSADRPAIRAFLHQKWGVSWPSHASRTMRP